MTVTSKIRSLRSTAQNPNNDDYIVIDGNTTGTRKMLASNINKTELNSLNRRIDEISTRIPETSVSVPTKLSELQNDMGFLTRIPDVYVTESKLASKGYLTEHQDLSNYATIASVNDKVDKATGMGLSQENFTTELKTKLEGIETNNPYKGKKWTALGDSLTMTTSSNSIKHTPNGRNYTYWVKEKLGIGTLVNMGLDSSTISTVRTSPQNFIQRMVDIPLDSDIITVFGGYNDMWDGNSKLGTINDTNTNTIYGALNKIARYLLVTYPKATIVFFTMLHWTWEREGSSTGGPYVENPNGLTSALLNQAIRDVCTKYSIPVIDLEKKSGIFPGTFNQSTKTAVKFPHFGYYTYDGLHLNERGHQKISNVIVSELLALNVGFVVEDTSVSTMDDPGETGTQTAIAWATKYTEKSSSSGGSSSGGSTTTVRVPLNVMSNNFSFANDNKSSVTNWTAGYAGQYTQTMTSLGINISTDASVVGDFTLKGTGVDGIQKISSSELSGNTSGETEVVAVQGASGDNFFVAFRLSHTRLGIDDNETDSTVKATKFKEFIAASDWYLEFNGTSSGGSSGGSSSGGSTGGSTGGDSGSTGGDSNYIDVSVSKASSLFTMSYENSSKANSSWTIGCACPYPETQSSLGLTISTDASVTSNFTLVGTDTSGIVVTNSSTLGGNASGDTEQVAVQGTSSDGFYLAFRLNHTRLGISDSESDTDVMLTAFKNYLSTCDWVLRFNK